MTTTQTTGKNHKEDHKRETERKGKQNFATLYTISSSISTQAATYIYLVQLAELAEVSHERTPTAYAYAAARSGSADAGEGADAPGFGQRHAQPPVVREPHLARELLQRQVPPVQQLAIRRHVRRRRHVDRGSQLLLQPPPPLLRVLKVHGRGGSGWSAAAAASSVTPAVLDRLVEQRDEALHLRVAGA